MLRVDLGLLFYLFSFFVSHAVSSLFYLPDSHLNESATPSADILSARRSLNPADCARILEGK